MKVLLPLFTLTILGFSNAFARPHYVILDKTPDVVVSKRNIDKKTLLFSKSSTSKKDLSNEFNQGMVFYWNNVSLDSVALTKTSPPVASRVYALVSVGQLDAIQASASVTETSSLVTSSEVSASILTYLYPDLRESFLDKKKRSFAYASKVKKIPDLSIVTSILLGEKIAKEIIQKAKKDGSSTQWTGTVPQGEGIWFSSQNPPLPPLLPLWGNVKTWFLTSGSEITPPAPPAFGSPEYVVALNEVRQISDTRTSEQTNIAKYWAAGSGTSTPPGMWNSIATDFIKAANVNDLRAAKILSALNMAMMDAFICAWNTKYTHWQLRPSQADPLIKLTIPLPNFPSYISGHATISGAASKVLGGEFPTLAGYFDEFAEEAAMSRLYGGIHYRYDNEYGLITGRTVGEKAASWLKSNKSLKRFKNHPNA
jgi:hypothetical protein